MKKQWGFTLIEIIVAIVLIGILSIVAVAIYQSVLNKAADSVRISDIHNLSSAYEVHYDGAYHVITPEQFSGKTIPLSFKGKTYSGLLTEDACTYKICTPLSNNPQTVCSSTSLDCFCRDSIQQPTGGNCDIQPNQNLVAKRAFVTEQLYGADMSNNPPGIAGANSLCQKAANEASLGGTWRAWISTNTVDARDNITTHHNGPYVLVDSAKTKIADNWGDLTDGSLDAPLSVTQFGQQITWEGAAYTNTNASGQKTALNTDCDGFTTLSTKQLNYGRPTKSGSEWTQESPISRCDHIKQLYCFEL